MFKRLSSLIAILAVSLLAACAQVPGGDDCGARPCRGCAQMRMEGKMDGMKDGKMCDPAKIGMHKRKHHRRHHVGAAHVAAAPAPAAAPAAAAPAAAPAGAGVVEGVKKIIKDVKDGAK